MRGKKVRAPKDLIRREDALDAIPSNWIDNLLTGPDAALRGDGGTWGCPDIERLLNAVREKVRAIPARSATAEGRGEGV